MNRPALTPLPRTGLATACALLIAGACPDALAAETYVAYDAYAGPRLTVDRWSPVTLERDRAIRAGVLRMKQRDLGLQLDNTGVVQTRFRTDFRNPAAVTQIRVNTVVNEASITGCAANLNGAGGAGALVGGTYFNAGPATPGSAINDVLAFAYVARPLDAALPAGELAVGAGVERCLDAACSTTAPLGLELDLGTTTVGTNVRLQVEWDAANNRFNFRRDTQSVQSIAYTVPDGTPPSVPWKALYTLNSLPSCLSGARTEGYVDAQFDTVSVNASAAP